MIRSPKDAPSGHASELISRSRLATFKAGPVGLELVDSGDGATVRVSSVDELAGECSGRACG